METHVLIMNCSNTTTKGPSYATSGRFWQFAGYRRVCAPVFQSYHNSWLGMTVRYPFASNMSQPSLPIPESYYNLTDFIWIDGPLLGECRLHIYDSATNKIMIAILSTTTGWWCTVSGTTCSSSRGCGGCLDTQPHYYYHHETIDHHCSRSYK